MYDRYVFLMNLPVSADLSDTTYGSLEGTYGFPLLFFGYFRLAACELLTCDLLTFATFPPNYCMFYLLVRKPVNNWEDMMTKLLIVL